MLSLGLYPIDLIDRTYTSLLVAARCDCQQWPFNSISFSRVRPSNEIRMREEKRRRVLAIYLYRVRRTSRMERAVFSFLFLGKILFSSLLSNFSQGIYRLNMQVPLLPTDFAIFEFLPCQCASFP